MYTAEVKMACSKEVRSQVGPSVEPSRQWRWRLPLITFVLVMVGGPLYWYGFGCYEAITTSKPRVDEGAYVMANQRLAAGADPYRDQGFLYTPAFVTAGTALTEWIGQRAYLILMRMACLLGLWILLWVSLSLTDWPPLVQGVAAAIVVTSPIVENGLGLGNVSLAILGPLAAALLLAHRRPVVAGVLLGGLNGLKPVGLTAIAVLLVQRSTWLPQGWRRTVGLAAAATLSLLLLVGSRHLGQMLQSVIRGRSEWSFNISLHRALTALGLPVPAPLLYGGGTLLAMALARQVSNDSRATIALATVASLFTLPVNNPHGFLLTLPVGVLAIDRTTARYRQAKREGLSVVVPLSTLALVLGSVLCTLNATGAVSASDLPPPLHGAVILIPFFAASVLAFHALRNLPAGSCTALRRPAAR